MDEEQHILRRGTHTALCGVYIGDTFEPAYESLEHLQELRSLGHKGIACPACVRMAKPLAFPMLRNGRG